MITNKKINFRSIAGTILPMAALMLAAILPLTALTTDLSYYGILRSQVEKATEAASVSGAQEYFRSMADAGRAVNSTVRVFKMNITEDTMVGNFYPSTGTGRPPTLTYSKTFTSADGINRIFRESPITVTVMTDLNRGKISVRSEITPNPFFTNVFPNRGRIVVAKEAELPPYDVVFVVDLSGSMRFTTINTYVGSARRKLIGAPGAGVLLPDVILYSGPYYVLHRGITFRANGYEITIDGVTDVIINTPGVDIPTNATYTDGRNLYVNDPQRGFVTRAIGSYDTNRPYSTVFSGTRINEARNSANNELRGLTQTFDEHRSPNRNIYENYYNRATQYVEPHASTLYGIRTFINTIRLYGTSTLNIGLVTFSTWSSTSDRTLNSSFGYNLRANNIVKSVRTIHPYIPLVEPMRFTEIPNALTIMLGNYTPNSIGTNGVPEGATNQNAGLESAVRTFDRSNRQNAEKIVILFTDGEPTMHSLTALGNKVRELTNRGITVYSILLTTGIGQGIRDAFRNAIENIGRAQPVILIDDPVQLEDAFLQIADELSLKLIS